MKSISRRNLFKYSAGAVGGSLISVGVSQNSWGIGKTAAQKTTTPDRALDTLYQGNKRFSSQKLQQPNRSSFRLQEVAKGQNPFAAILGCADSRVPSEIIFDQGLGDLFVVRVAGNVATPEEIGSLEYGTLVLGAKVILVLGHERCGAVDATIQAKPVPGKIGSILEKIQPAVTATAGQSGDRLKNATIANIKNQIAELKTSSVLTDLIKAGKLKIVGGFYDLDTGVVAPVA
jgi:carbonic anhydrase